MGKKKTAAGKATCDIKIHKGRTYCLTQTTKWYGCDHFMSTLTLLGAEFSSAIDGEVTHLVTADGTLSKTTQKKVDGLVKKGAVIEVVSSEDLPEHTSLPPELVGALLQGGDGDRALLSTVLNSYRWDQPEQSVEPKGFAGLAWSDSVMHHLELHDMDFSKAVLPKASLFELQRSKFDSAELVGGSVTDATDCSFKGANLRDGRIDGECAGAVFDGADLSEANIDLEEDPDRDDEPPSFRAAKLDGAEIEGIEWEGVDFSKCSAVKSRWEEVEAPSINLAGADLTGASFTEVDFSDANLTNAILKNARLNNVDLSTAKLKGADFTGAVLVETQVDPKLKKESIKGLALALEGAPTGGAALAALDAAVLPAKKIEIELLLQPKSEPSGSPDPAKKNLKMDLSLENGSYGRLIHSYAYSPHRKDIVNDFTDTFSEGFLRCVMFFTDVRVCFESITVKASKSPTPGPKIRELMVTALAEFFDQTPPPEAELKKLTKEYRAKLKAVKDAELAKRKKEDAARDKKRTAERAKEAEEERAARPQPAEKVKDLETFMAAMEVRADAGRVKNAKKMLKGAGFELFQDTSDPKRVLGVIKSQSDDKLVYAVKLDSDGKFSCCTQNLRPCGGLRGALCKHHLVLLLGLVQAGAIKPGTVDQWVEKSLDEEPELDKEEMGEVLLKYKGAEAGEIDWRPTETVPEDFYAF